MCRVIYETIFINDFCSALHVMQSSGTARNLSWGALLKAQIPKFKAEKQEWVGVEEGLVRGTEPLSTN